MDALIRALGVALLCFPSASFGFVLLSGPDEARLEVSEDLPTVTFWMNEETPPIDKKEEYADGAYKDLSDADLWKQLIRDSMSVWNNVSGSYIQLELADDTVTDSETNPGDLINVITVGKSNATTSAAASPVITDKLIIDCDIAVSDRSHSAKTLAFTLAHELGHCLGLGHNHASYRSIMSYSRSDTTLKLGADDVGGLIYLYPSAAAAGGKPKEVVECGVINQAKSRGQPWNGLIILAIPLILGPLALRRRADFHDPQDRQY